MKSSPDVAAYSWYRFRFPLAPATFLTPCSYVHLYLSDAPMFKVLSLIYILFYFLHQSLNAAHKDWICALDFMKGTNTLLSGCRGGYLKLWNIDTCAQIAEIKAHSSPVNAIATNSSAIFTASK